MDVDNYNRSDDRDDNVENPSAPEETHLLKNHSVLLDNGLRGYVFSKQNAENEASYYFCHVCQSTLYNWKTLQSHISGKKHSAAMQKCVHPNFNFPRIVETWEVPPGEPAPPGMEDLVEHKCAIQTKIDAYKAKPLIGLEYVVELTSDQMTPSYCCSLCNKHGPDNNIIKHLASQQHYMKYLQIFFPLLYSALSLVPKTPEFKKGTEVVLLRIMKKIETKYGRMKPKIFPLATYQVDKVNILKEIDQEFHIRETTNDNYMSMVNWAEIKNLQYGNSGEKESCSSDSEVELENKNSATENNTDEKSNNTSSLFNKTDRKKAEKRQLRKDRESDSDSERPKVKENSSPDVVIIDSKSEKPSVRRASLSSISTISSDTIESPIRDSKRPRSRSSSRSSARRSGKYSVNSKFSKKSRSRSRSRSFGRRRSPYRSRYSLSRSKSPRGRYHRSRSPRHVRSRRDRSPYQRRSRYSYSRSRSRSPHSSRNQRPQNRQSRYRPAPEKSMNKSLYSAREKPLDIPKHPDANKWELLFDKMRTIMKDLNEKLKFYEENPEKHPRYPKEWKLFWNRRYKELQSSGKDPATHDFKPEWIAFWNNRMKEIHNEDLKREKDELKIKLCLTDVFQTDDKLSDDTQNELKTDITVADIKNTWKALTGSDIKESEKNPASVSGDAYFNINVDRPKESHLRSSAPPPGARIGFIPFDDNSPRVISVLRLISVLESQIGSLGPQILGLLSKAIAMEKIAAGSSQDILYEEENCVLFETVKEKLKGLFFAGLVDRNFVNAAKVAVKNIVDLLQSAPRVFPKNSPALSTLVERFPVMPTPVPAPAPVQPVPSAPVTVPGIGTVDRVAIAQQIASALIAQGKTDVTEEELEQLINAVIGMAQASASSVASTSAASEHDLQSHQQTVHESVEQISGEQTDALKLLQSAYDEETGVAEDQDKGKNIQNVMDEAIYCLLNDSKNISDLELKFLVEHFRELEPEVQLKLVTFFKTLQSDDPAKIVALENMVDFSTLLGSDGTAESNSGSVNDFQKNSRRNNYDANEDDEDDDDYSVDDVYKAASERIRLQELIEERNKVASMLSNVSEISRKADNFVSDSSSQSSLQVPYPSQPAVGISEHSSISKSRFGEYDANPTHDFYTKNSLQQSSYNSALRDQPQTSRGLGNEGCSFNSKQLPQIWEGNTQFTNDKNYKFQSGVGTQNTADSSSNIPSREGSSRPYNFGRF